MHPKTTKLLTTHTLYRREPALPEAEVQRVARELGLDSMQARNHVRCRIQLLDVTVRRKACAGRCIAYNCAMDYANELKYTALDAELRRVEEATGLYLRDVNVTRENVLDGGQADDGSEQYFAEMYRHACAEAGMRAEEAGANINTLLGRTIY